MAGIVRTGNGFSGIRRKFGNRIKGEIMENKNMQDMLSHVQALRGEKKTLDLPDDSPPAQPVQTPPVQPTAPANLTQTAQAPGHPPAFVQPAPTPVAPPPMAPPQMAPPAMAVPGLTPEQTNYLTMMGMPVTPQQMQYLMMGYQLTQALLPQQLMALGYPTPAPQMQMPQQPMMPAMPQMPQMPQMPAANQPKGSLFQTFEKQVNQVGVSNFDLVDQKKISIKFGVIGTGQGGSRLAEAFYNLGYPTCVVNTAPHDLQNINIPDENKQLLHTGSGGGAGKELQQGEDAATDFAEDILDLMKNTFPRDIEHILVCCGGGGGSGSGSLPKVIDMAKVMGVPVGVVYTLPKDSEGSKVKENAFNRLRVLDNKLAAGEISPIIIVDNNKIHEMHIGVSLAKFWRLANAQVAGLFHLFNVLSAQNSAYASFDPADYRTIIQSKGCLLFGSTVVDDSSRKTAVAKALRENVGKGLLAEGFDLSLSKIAGVIVTGSQDLMESVPQENIDAAIECLERLVGGGTLHHGIYVENNDKLTVYTLIGGLPLPDERINRLLKPA